MSRQSNDADLEDTTATLKALAHELRLRLMLTLFEAGETSVGEIEAITGIGQPGLSQQLAILRKAELVSTRRDAKLVFYSLNAAALRKTAKLLARMSGLSMTSQAAAKPAAQSRARGSAAAFAKIL